MSVSDGRNPKNLEGRPEEENNSFRPREFFWDSVTLYVVSVIFALAAVDALTEFIRGSNVSCLVAPADNCSDKFSDSLNDYVREFCSAYVPSTEFFPAFIFVHALLIAIPHYLWLNHYGGNFDFFFAQASLLDRLRDEKTGKYSGNNRLILQQLTTAFSTYKKNWMFVLYLVKLSVQLLITLAGLIITIAVFTDFKTTFYCPENLNNNDPEFWPLNKRVICVFKSLRLFGAIQTANLILLCLLTNALIWSLLWCLSAHPTELGSQKEARFSFETGIAPDFYVPPLQLISCLLNFPFQSITRTLSRFLTSLPIPTLVGPKISTNLDFMVMKLFRTDSGLGHVFREMQVLQWIKEKEDHEQGIVELHKSQQASKVMADGCKCHFSVFLARSLLPSFLHSLHPPLLFFFLPLSVPPSLLPSPALFFFLSYMHSSLPPSLLPYFHPSMLYFFLFCMCSSFPPSLASSLPPSLPRSLLPSLRRSIE